MLLRKTPSGVLYRHKTHHLNVEDIRNNGTHSIRTAGCCCWLPTLLQVFVYSNSLLRLLLCLSTLCRLFGKCTTTRTQHTRQHNIDIRFALDETVNRLHLHTTFASSSSLATAQKAPAYIAPHENVDYQLHRLQSTFRIHRATMRAMSTSSVNAKYRCVLIYYVLCWKFMSFNHQNGMDYGMDRKPQRKSTQNALCVDSNWNASNGKPWSQNTMNIVSFNRLFEQLWRCIDIIFDG